MVDSESPEWVVADALHDAVSKFDVGAGWIGQPTAELVAEYLCAALRAAGYLPEATDESDTSLSEGR